ncbi:hypothetical protein [Nocardioides bigeumensis]|uniref:O-antigen/teichoic acid export membrane protein n=1 Tax=Nocardioides bigeumensis TaxID=433657 RepID=A0ABN2XT12_9ACTN
MPSVDREEISVRRLTQGGALNAGAAAVATLAGVAILFLAARAMSPAENASFISIWGLVFGCASIVAALEPEVARVRSLAPGPLDGTQLAVTAIVAACAAGGMTLVVVALFDVFHMGSVWVALLVIASAAAFPTMFAARGYLAGSMRLTALSAMTAAEALVRLLVVLVALWVAVDLVPGMAAAAFCSALIGVPVLLRHATWTRGAESVRAMLRRTTTLMAGNAMAAALLTGAPVLVELAMVGASRDFVGRLQNAIVISRFPLIALMLLQGLLVPVFVRRRSLYAGGDYRTILLFLSAVVPLSGVASYVAGPWLLSSLLGSSYVIGHLQIALLTTGAAALGGVQVLIALAVSGDRHRLATLALAPTLTVTALLAFAPVVGLSMRIPVALTIGPMVGFAVAVAATMRWRRQQPTAQP